MTTRILGSFATFVAIIALFGASAVNACQTITVVNNTGVNVRIRMYDNTGATVLNVVIPAAGGMFNPPAGAIGFISEAGTQVPGGNPCATSCFVIPLANGTPGGPCVSACGNGCTLTLNPCNGPCTP